MGFHRPRGERMLADGVPYDKLDLVELRRAIGVVMQHPPLFAGTILENVSYGCPEATPDDIARAARLALADEFIKKLPRGYDTHVGEDGALLSGREAQRIALVRALLRRPRMLILDEPTKNLEGAVIDRLMTNLRSVEERPAIVTISHDEKALRHADYLYWLEDGVIHPIVPDAAGPGATIRT
jgi:ABC-type multidrug transport system fused ATPase/permease subunit